MSASSPRDPAEEARRFAEYARRPTPELRDEIVRTHLPLAVHLARRYVEHGVPLDDLVQVASLGLMQAVDRFDPDRGFAFATFAAPTILGELKRHFRTRTWDAHVPRRVQELYLALNTFIEQLGHRLGRSPTIGELAAAARVSEEEVLEAIEAGESYHAQALDGPSGFPDDEVRAAIARPDLDLGVADDRLLVELLLDALPPREQLIVRLAFFEGMTQRDIATRLGISQMHVSRLLKRSLEALRTHPALDPDPEPDPEPGARSSGV